MNRNMFVTLSADETGWNSVFTQLIVILGLDQTQLNTVLCDSYHKNLVLSANDHTQLHDTVNILQPFDETTVVTWRPLPLVSFC